MGWILGSTEAKTSAKKFEQLEMEGDLINLDTYGQEPTAE